IRRLTPHLCRISVVRRTVVVPRLSVRFVRQPDARLSPNVSVRARFVSGHWTNGPWRLGRSLVASADDGPVLPRRRSATGGWGEVLCCVSRARGRKAAPNRRHPLRDRRVADRRRGGGGGRLVPGRRGRARGGGVGPFGVSGDRDHD